jgi:hypothetical protein
MALEAVEVTERMGNMKETRLSSASESLHGRQGVVDQ